jgi:hypothetical protein
MLSIITSIKNPDINLFLKRLELYQSLFNDGLKMEWIIQDYDKNSIIADYITNVPFISYVSEEDSGIYQAWNRALSRANGDKICFLGIDDEPVANWIKFAAKFRLIDNEAITCKVQMICEGKPNGVRANPNIGYVDLSSVSYAHPGFFFSSEIFSIGKFDENYSIISDGLFYSNFGPIKIIGQFDEIGVMMNTGGISNSIRGSRQRFIELFHAFRFRNLTFNYSNFKGAMASFPAFIFSFLPLSVFRNLQRARWRFLK